MLSIAILRSPGRLPGLWLRWTVWLLIGFAPAASGQTVRVDGAVVDASNGRAVTGVAIVLEGSGLAAETDARGRFRFEGVRPGDYQLVARHIAYAPTSASISIEPGFGVDITVRIATRPIDLDPVEVTVRSGKLAEVGYYDRRDTGGLSGHYLTQDDLVRRAAARMTDVLVDVPGVRVLPLEPGKTTIRFNRRVGEAPMPGQRRRYALDPPRNALDLRGCEPDFYIDGRLHRWSSPPIVSSSRGAMMADPLSRVDDFNVIPVNAIDGIEIYVGAAVPPFVRSTGCGVILLWTRR